MTNKDCYDTLLIPIVVDNIAKRSVKAHITGGRMISGKPA
jgi:hypothetical protein